MATIKPLGDHVKRLLQTGQVLLDAISCVKELLENALDAGASSIEVKVAGKGGLDSISVKDNGSGMSPDDLACCALRHHTSKLTAFDDLTKLTTYGFRGEALASLCAIADVRITSCRAVDQVATQVAYSHNGNPTRFVARVSYSAADPLRLSHCSTTRIAAGRGTTVEAARLFATLPVRRKVFSRVTTGIHFTSSSSPPLFALLLQYCLEQARGLAQRLLFTIGAYAILHPSVRLTLSCPPSAPIIKPPCPDMKVDTAFACALPPGMRSHVVFPSKKCICAVCPLARLPTLAFALWWFADGDGGAVWPGPGGRVARGRCHPAGAGYGSHALSPAASRYWSVYSGANMHLRLLPVHIRTHRGGSGS